MKLHRVSRALSFRRREASIAALTRLARDDRPIVAGPWTGGVGMELLYWIPLLRWLTTTGGVDPARIVAVSRGGADPWYRDVAGRYVDLLDSFTTGQLQRWHGNRTQRRDREAFDRARRLAGSRDAAWLQPSTMQRLFAPRWEAGASAAVIASHTVQQPLPPEGDVVLPPLPQEYVAVKLSYSRAFPESRENRAALEAIVRYLAERTEVVLLRSQEEAPGHTAFEPERLLPVIDLYEHLSARQNLAVQSRVIRGARLFVCSYGGFSFLGPYVGTSTLAVYADAPLELAHLDAIDRIGERFAEDGGRLFRARHIGSVSPAQRPPSPVRELVPLP